MTPAELAIHRDRIIAERGWTADTRKILNTRCVSHSDHRAILAYELSRLDRPGWTWDQIADCLGFSNDSVAISASHNHIAAEERFTLARQLAFERRRAENYGSTQ